MWSRTAILLVATTATACSASRSPQSPSSRLPSRSAPVVGIDAATPCPPAEPHAPTPTTPAPTNADHADALEFADFDFDGHEDVAVRTGHEGPYGSASYVIFLRRDDSYQPAPGLTALTQEAMGLPEVRTADGRLRTISKSGCCLHWTSEYTVVDGEPVLQRTETREHRADGSCWLVTETRTANDSWSTTSVPCPQ